MNTRRAIVAGYFAACLALAAQAPAVSALQHDDVASPALAPTQQSISPGGGKDSDYSELVRDVHRQVNEFRRRQGLAPLRLDAIISAQAREHSTDMARNGRTISHGGFKERLEEIRQEIPYRAAAENVAANAGHENPARTAVEGWQNSPGHRENMLGDFSLTGIGVAQNQEGAYFFTQIFLLPLE